MATERVRVSKLPGEIPGTAPAATRRKPRQSRARASSEALQEAFVRVLLERGYAGVTVREVAAVAGVGVGTFYEYVGNKQALAALTIHMRVKSLAQALQAGIEVQRGRPLVELVGALLDQQVSLVMADATSWAALFMVERLVSTPEAYRKHYDQFVDLWEQALAVASDAPGGVQLAEQARMVHAISYGWITQSLLTQGPTLSQLALRQEMERAVLAYLLHGTTAQRTV